MRSMIPAEVKARFRLPARLVGMTGAALMMASIVLSWSYGHDVLDDVGYYGAPSPLQLFFGLLALITLTLLAIPLLGKERLGRWAKVLAWNTAARRQPSGPLPWRPSWSRRSPSGWAAWSTWIPGGGWP